MSPLPADAVHPLTVQAWRDWLQGHHRQERGIGLVSSCDASKKQPVLRKTMKGPTSGARKRTLCERR